MRKKKHPEHVNHERWLISYADFITLLFAFFVVMFASSQVDSKKMGRFTESFAKAVGIEVFPQSGNSIMPGELISNNRLNDLPKELEQLRNSIIKKSKLDPSIAGMQVVARHQELILRLPDSIVFDSGDDKIKPQAHLVLEQLGEELGSKNFSIRIEGHTDNIPINNFRFRSNWDLSTARATAVIAEFATQKIIHPENLSAAGYGEFHPIASNGTQEGRAQNRRVDLVVNANQLISNEPKN